MAYGKEPPLIEYRSNPISILLNGTSEKIDAPTGAMDLGTSDGTYFVRFKNTGNDGSSNYLFSYLDGGIGISYLILSTGIVRGIFYGTSTITTSGTTDVGADDTIHTSFLEMDRDGDMQIFLDGESEDNDDISTLSADDITTATAKGIGYNINGTNLYFQGELYDFMFFDCILTAAQKTEVRAGTIPSAVRSNLLCRYTFNGNTQDMSGNEYHGTATATVNYPKPTEIITLPKLSQNGIDESMPATRYFINILGQPVARVQKGRFTCKYSFIVANIDDYYTMRDSLATMFNTTRRVILYPNSDIAINYEMIVTDLQWKPLQGTSLNKECYIEMISVRNNITRQTSTEFAKLTLNLVY